MTNEDAIKILTQMMVIDDYRVEALEMAVESLKKQINVESVIDQLWEDIESTGTTYSVDGDTISTDVGYADDGIEFFIKHLKERLKAANENDTVGEWIRDQFGNFFGSVLCSKCNFRIAFEFPFCPNCGQRKKKDSR